MLKGQHLYVSVNWGVISNKIPPGKRCHTEGDNWGMFHKGRIHKRCKKGIGKPQGVMQHPKTRNNKAPINFPRPERARKETSYQNQRVQAVGRENCLTKAVVFVEGSRQPKETQRGNPEKQYPHLTLLPSCFFWYSQLTNVNRKPEGSRRSTLIRSIWLSLLGCTRRQRGLTWERVWRDKMKCPALAPIWQIPEWVGVTPLTHSLLPCAESTKEIIQTSSIALDASSKQGYKKGSECAKTGDSHEIIHRAWNVFLAIERQQAQLTAEKVNVPEDIYIWKLAYIPYPHRFWEHRLNSSPPA